MTIKYLLSFIMTVLQAVRPQLADDTEAAKLVDVALTLLGPWVSHAPMVGHLAADDTAHLNHPVVTQIASELPDPQEWRGNPERLLAWAEERGGRR